MSTPGIISGGLGFFRSVGRNSQPISRQGVFARGKETPGATPKYARNRGKRDAESRTSMARLFINVPADKISELEASLSPETRPLARVLMASSEQGGGSGTGFMDFLLTSANESFQEKTQIVDTLTDNYVAFYSGQEPAVFDYSGVLLNTYQDDQRVWMLRLYREILRGSRLAGRNLIANLRYDSFIVSGYLESLQLSLRGDDVDSSTFRFTLRVKQMSVFTASLGAPTVVEGSPNATSVITGRAPELNKNNLRGGAVSAEEPTTPSAGPAAQKQTLNPVLEQATRTRLKELGSTDAQATSKIEEVKAVAYGPPVDARESVRVKAVEGEDRPAAFVTGSDASKSNPDHVSNDVQGGQTNVRAAPGESISLQENEIYLIALVPLVDIPPRDRGLEPVALQPLEDTYYAP